MQGTGRGRAAEGLGAASEVTLRLRLKQRLLSWLLSVPVFFCQDLPCDPSRWGPKLIQLLKNKHLGRKGGRQAGRSWLSRPFCVPGIELCPPGKRFMITMVASLVATAGQFLMPGLAALCRDWQVLQALIICPFLLMLLYWS